MKKEKGVVDDELKQKQSRGIESCIDEVVIECLKQTVFYIGCPAK